MEDTQNDGVSMGRRWLMFAAVYLIGIMAGVCMFKAPPLFTTEFVSDLGFTDHNIGWVMSIFAMTCMILAFPANAVLSKLGPKKSLYITIVSLIFGAGLGAIAPNDAVMLVSRFIEGVGMGLVSVVGPAAVSTIIPIEKRGLAMGIWAIYVNVGIVVAFNAAPVIYAVCGTWRAVWWSTVLFGVAVLAFFSLIYKETPHFAPESQTNDGAISIKPDMLSVWLLGLAFCAWSMVNHGSIGTFYPAYLSEVHAFDTQMSGTVSSITNIFVLILGPVSGYISDRFRIRKGFLVGALFGTAALLTFGFGDSLTMMWAFVLLMIFTSSAAGTGAFALVPFIAKDPSHVGFVMSVMTFLQNVGILVGSATMGSLASMLGWNEAAWVFCIPIALIGGVLSVLIKVDKNKA